MFTFLVQLWLSVIALGLLGLAFQHIYVTMRDGRQKRRQLAAHFYAQLVVMDRVQKGELEGASLAEIDRAYQFEKIAYLNQ